MIPALDQRAYLEALKLPEGVALRLRQNARYSPSRRHTWNTRDPEITLCAVCGLTWHEVTEAPEVVVCLGFTLREEKL